MSDYKHMQAFDKMTKKEIVDRIAKQTNAELLSTAGFTFVLKKK